jgi:hypothetical protein
MLEEKTEETKQKSFKGFAEKVLKVLQRADQDNVRAVFS